MVSTLFQERVAGGMTEFKGLAGLNLGYLSFIGSCVGARRTAGPSAALGMTK